MVVFALSQELDYLILLCSGESFVIFLIQVYEVLHGLVSVVQS